MPMVALAALASLTLASAPAAAAVLIDQLGAGTGNGFSNDSAQQNFLIEFTLTSPAEITGFEINGDPVYPYLGQSVTIRLRADASGVPSTTNLDEFLSTVSSITPVNATNEVVGATFAPIPLAAGTYWIGMSGTNSELSWDAFGGGFLPGQYQLTGEALSFSPGVGQFGYEILGTAVPEPAAWTMMLLSIGALGAVARKARRANSAAGLA
jgi:hypothetical protein